MKRRTVGIAGRLIAPVPSCPESNREVTFPAPLGCPALTQREPLVRNFAAGVTPPSGGPLFFCAARETSRYLSLPRTAGVRLGAALL
jgi:hypothetical protein